MIVYYFHLNDIILKIDERGYLSDFKKRKKENTSLQKSEVATWNVLLKKVFLKIS